MSKIEQLICNRDFSYLQPYFYNNPYALRCELGIGDELQYMANANQRALEICNILFPDGADAFIFNYWIYDNSDSGEADRHDIERIGDDAAELIQNTIDCEVERLRFLLENQVKYRHIAIKNLETYEGHDEYPEKERRNRIVCFADAETKIDHAALVDMQINGIGYEIGIVSFKNECILSVYDDRGCDIVFATPEKMREFYPQLKPFFLSYDIDEMEKRFNN